ncbi:MAG: hypothetical protein JWQ07_3832 [Ramlibacter sp.]|nr:hypothetical protein [Ramlibacter sp.]
MGCMQKALAAAGIWAAIAVTPAIAGRADFGGQGASADTQYVAQWIMETADHRGLPFAVVDKRQARIYVFEGSGRLLGAAPALLGETVGDQSSPDVGEHTQAGAVPLDERTTPAGRFLSEPGRNLSGEQVVWVDYDAAFAIHRLRAGASKRGREARLASPKPQDKRASLGCVVVPVAFYENVVQPMLGKGRAVVYVLPETQPVREMFGAL